jgi:hypothetical protein
MTYYGVVLLLAGYQADEQHILKQYRAMIDQYDTCIPLLCVVSHAYTVSSPGILLGHSGY